MYFDDDSRDPQFADPGGRSALRAASRSNPRNRPCPTCKKPNRLTPKDVALGYQCGSCANAAESGWVRGLLTDEIAYLSAIPGRIKAGELLGWEA